MSNEWSGNVADVSHCSRRGALGWNVRIAKEQISYGKELESQQKRVDKLIEEGADEADVRKQKEVLEETVQMIPDVKRRLAAAYQELFSMVVSVYLI